MIDFNILNKAEAQPDAAADEFVITKIRKSDADKIHQGQAIQKPYDIEAAKASFRQFDKQIEQVHAAITGFEIETAADAATFTETVGVAKQLFNAIEAKRKELIKDADTYVRSLNAFALKPKKKLKDVETLGKNKIGQYNYQQEIKRREDEKKIQDAADAAQAKIDAQAKKAGVESLQLPPMTAPKKLEPIRTETASSSTRYKKTFEIIDFAQLDDAYKTVDAKKLQAAIDAGLRPAGIKIKEVPIVSIRSN